MPEERNTSIRKDIAEKGREVPKKGNAHEFNSKEDELRRKGRKNEREDNVQEYEEEQEADVRGG